MPPGLIQSVLHDINGWIFNLHPYRRIATRYGVVIGVVAFGTLLLFAATKTKEYARLIDDAELASSGDKQTTSHFGTNFRFSRDANAFSLDLATIGYTVSLAMDSLGLAGPINVLEGFPADPNQPDYDCNIYDFESQSVYIFSNEFYNQPFIAKSNCPRCESNPSCQQFYMVNAVFRMLVGLKAQQSAAQAKVESFLNPIHAVRYDVLAHMTTLLRFKDLFYLWIPDRQGYIAAELDRIALGLRGEFKTSTCADSEFGHEVLCTLVLVTMYQQNPNLIDNYMKRAVTGRIPPSPSVFFAPETVTRSDLMRTLQLLILREGEHLYAIQHADARRRTAQRSKQSNTKMP